MKFFSKFVSNHNILILVISLLLLIPSIIGYVNTRINYDILVYLPEEYETIKGERILTDDFGLGSYAFVMIDFSDSYKVMKLENKIRKIDGVKKVFSINDVIGSTIPKDMLPNEVQDKLYSDDTSIIMVTFNESTSADSTVHAVDELRSVVGDASKISSMTSLVLDTRDISNNEMVVYVLISVLLCLIVLVLATDSYVIPIFLLGNIGFAILYNMGTNIFLGDICYITKAITAVLQLGVTTDYSIFLYHKYEQIKSKERDKRKAMALAIDDTFKSVVGSSFTTFAGFLALCAMPIVADAYGAYYNPYGEYDTSYNTQQKNNKLNLGIRFFVGLNTALISYDKTEITYKTAHVSEEQTTTKINYDTFDKAGFVFGVD